MTFIELPLDLVAFVESAQNTVEQQPDGGLRIGDGETDLVVSPGSQGYTVERVSRGQVVRVELATESRDALARFLVVWFGDPWRESHGLPPLRTPVEPEPLPPGHETAGIGWRRELRWDEGRSSAREMPHTMVISIARALAHPLAEVIASMRDPKGRPVFPQDGGG